MIKTTFIFSLQLRHLVLVLEILFSTFTLDIDFSKKKLFLDNFYLI